MVDNKDISYRVLSSALRQVITRPQLANALQATDTRDETMEKLKITEEIRTEILNILNDLDRLRPKEATETVEAVANGNSKEITTDRKFMLESFDQLRLAYRISMTMSCVMFIVGLAFLVIAAVRSFVDPQSIAVTSIIGGIGVVQIVALFYRNPLTHIARTVSNAQQAKMAVMSYLIGISLLNEQIGSGKPSDGHLQNLIQLTEKALGHLQKYTEEGAEQTNDRQKPSASSPDDQ